MPELPDITAYLNALETRIVGATLETIRIGSPFLLRTVDPSPQAAQRCKVEGLQRIGKRIVIRLERELSLVIHLMIAGRFRWVTPGGKIPGKIGLAAFDFDSGTLLLTEAGSKRRASLHIVRGLEALEALDPGGGDPLTIGLGAFTKILKGENHTVKRILTDPHLLSGIGNAYSDEILHDARISPIRLSQKMTVDEIARLHGSMRRVLRTWTDTLVAESNVAFPEKVTAFRKEMAVHGKFDQPCPVCSSPVQRIVYADNETNYCARCQTDGKRLADRALSRLLGSDWPRSIDEL
ncbi:MAG TPA: DNA-formamidopyrimidine glycosylase family protein [Thermoanaerobaculia bacterium]|nr:DNA-formamidopyrimidine glycosylase family protein [Thermoanaerobaculia bacterium]